MGIVSSSESVAESDDDEDNEDVDAARLFRFLWRFLGAVGFTEGGGIVTTSTRHKDIEDTGCVKKILHHVNR